MPFDSTSPEYYPHSNFKLGGTDGMRVPSGTTVQRPTDDILGNGMIRYNLTTTSLEAYVAGAWSIIRVPGTSTIVKDTATGNGVLTAFNMLTTAPANEKNVLVFINNVFQEASVAYTIATTTVTFSSPPPNSHTIVALSGFDTV